MNIFEKTIAHILFLFLFSLVVINSGFVLGITITRLTLPVCYLLYITGFFAYTYSTRKSITKVHVACIIFFALLFFIAAFYFGKTYDASFDGQDYHSGAVIELVHGWNPWRDLRLPIQLPDSMPYIIGYPKSLWLIQAGIFALTGTLNAATVTNFFILIVSITFVYGALRRLQISRTWALVVTPLITCEPNFLQQYFTFMSDGFSYELALIAITSFIMLIHDDDKLWPIATSLSACIFMAGIKYSILPVAGLIGVLLCIYLLRKITINTRFVVLTELFLLLAIIILWVPYIHNSMIYKNPLYPSNEAFAKTDLVQQNIPFNLRSANRLTLLFYGIYSKTQQTVGYADPKNIAVLKLPFTTSVKEIPITNDWDGRVGGEGVLFSGLFTVSLLLYIFFIFQYKNIFMHKKRFFLLTVTLLLIFISVLADPTPNVMRLVSVIYLIPFSLLIILITSKAYRYIPAVRILSVIFAMLITANMLIKFIPTLYARDQEMKAENYLLTSMKNSKQTYQIKTTSFYSSYELLKEHGVNFQKAESLSCKHPHSLWIMFTTYYCP